MFPRRLGGNKARGGIAFQKLRLPSLERGWRLRAFAGRLGRLDVLATRFDHRTKNEHLATILLPNPVAADDTERHAPDHPLKICRQINTRWGGGSRAAIAITEFRVRCSTSPVPSERDKDTDDA
jgi:hypothetical protein